MSDNGKKNEKDEVSGVETTGHEWDGLKELNTPSPRWWLWLFLVTIIWSFGYWVLYPTWPSPGGNTPGTFAWTKYKELASSQAEITALRGKLAGRIHASSLDQIKNDPALYEFARAGGSAAFKENCTVCHGTGAEGKKGFPNLNDDDWLHGGKLVQIYKTIRTGVRSGHPEAHNTQMPSFGRDGILTPAQVNDVIAYVGDLHKGKNAPKPESSARGKKIFADNCAVCHGVNGEGNQEMGAPRLNDEIWLYGGDPNTLYETVMKARAGVMPTWEKRLPDDVIKELAIYVHSLGGGK